MLETTDTSRNLSVGCFYFPGLACMRASVRDFPLVSAQVLLPIVDLHEPACFPEPRGAGNVILSSCTLFQKHFSALCCYGKREIENKESFLILLALLSPAPSAKLVTILPSLQGWLYKNERSTILSLVTFKIYYPAFLQEQFLI